MKLMIKKAVKILMNKVLKIVSAFFKIIYNFLDKVIITPISRLIYSINEKLKGKSYISKLINII